MAANIAGKKLIPGAICALACIALSCPASAWISGTASAAPVEVNVGVLLPLSGPSADEGLMIQRGLELAVRELSQSAETKIVLRTEDTQADTKTAVSAYKMLRAKYSVPLIITWGSGIGVALMPLVDQDRVVQIGVATSTPKYSAEGDFSLRLFPSAVHEGEFIGKRVPEVLGKKKFAVLAASNDYGLGLAPSFKQSLEARGGTVVGEEYVQTGDSDFSPSILRLRAKSPDAMYIACYAACGALVVRQARQLGLDIPLIASSASVGLIRFAEAAGPSAEGLYADLPGPDYYHPASPEVQRFVELYRAAYHEEVDPMIIMAARGYDALHLASLAAKKCRTLDPLCLRDTLLAVRDFAGASGTLSFDAAGDVLSSFGVYQIKSKKFVTVLSPDSDKQGIR